MVTVSVAAEQGTAGSADEPADRAFYERLIKKIEPALVGVPERLPLYIRFFQREMINDTRLFPFHVEAQRRDDGTVVLSGFVGFRENREALFGFLRYLGFEDVHDQIEVLPSDDLGPAKFGLISVSHAFSYDQPTGRREVLTDCLLGSPVYLLKEADAGPLLCHSAEGYVGYVDGENIRRVNGKEFSQYLSGPQVLMRKDFKARDVGLLPMGSRLKSVGREGEAVAVQLPTGERLSIPADACQTSDGRPNPSLERVIQNAHRLVGTDYLWGGNTSQGIDCSGLVQIAFGVEGINLPRDSNQQVYLGELVATRWYRTRLRPGDTLYFLGKHGKIRHTAIYLSDGQYLESVRPAARVTSFIPEDKNYNAGRDAAFAFGKRLLE
jgi:hypothetical protein